AAVAVAGGSAGADDPISDDEFEALLDQLHGASGAPGTEPVPTATPAAAPPRVPAAPARAPVAAPPPSAANGDRDSSVRVNTRRLDTIVDLVGELVLARNRLKTLRTRLRDEELDRAVSTLDIATARLQGAV